MQLLRWHKVIRVSVTQSKKQLVRNAVLPHYRQHIKS